MNSVGLAREHKLSGVCSHLPNYCRSVAMVYPVKSAQH